MIKPEIAHDRVEIQEAVNPNVLDRRKLIVMLDGWAAGDYENYTNAADGGTRLKKALNDTVEMCIEIVRQTCSDCMSHSYKEPSWCRKCAGRVAVIRQRMGLPR